MQKIFKGDWNLKKKGGCVQISNPEAAPGVPKRFGVSPLRWGRRGDKCYGVP